MKYTAKTIMSSLVLLLLSNSLFASESDGWDDWTSTTSITLSQVLASVSNEIDELASGSEDEFFDSIVRIEEDLVALEIVDDAISDFQDKFSLSEGQLEATVLPDELPDELPGVGGLLPDLK